LNSNHSNIYGECVAGGRVSWPVAWILLKGFSFAFILIIVRCHIGFAGEGVEWGRVKFLPELSVGEEYTDNVFLTKEDEHSDFITTISPELSVDFAVTPESILSLGYKGDFEYHSQFDNFRKDHHHPRLSWTLTQPKGSRLEVGAMAHYSSYQPYSKDGRPKDYVRNEAFVDTLLKLGGFTDLGLKYDYVNRRFDSSRDAIDEFDRNSVTVDVIYNRLQFTSLLLEYNYSHQNNNDLGGPSTDMDTHTLYGGMQWETTARLSGTFKAGYTQTDVDEFEDSGGFALDTDLTYRFSSFNKFNVRVFRSIVSSTRTARESGVYYVSTGGSLTATCEKWEPLRITATFSYTNNSFKGSDSVGGDREDDYFSAGLQTRYPIRNRLSLLLRYQYRSNDSDFKADEYDENLAEIRLVLTI
jgi:hypothetical protein